MPDFRYLWDLDLSRMTTAETPMGLWDSPIPIRYGDRLGQGALPVSYDVYQLMLHKAVFVKGRTPPPKADRQTDGRTDRYPDRQTDRQFGEP